jgi:hypothetical protein
MIREGSSKSPKRKIIKPMLIYWPSNHVSIIKSITPICKIKCFHGKTFTILKPYKATKISSIRPLCLGSFQALDALEIKCDAFVKALFNAASIFQKIL